MTAEGSQIAIRLDLEAIQKLQLNVNSYSVAQAIAGAKLHLKQENVLCAPPAFGPRVLESHLGSWRADPSYHLSARRSPWLCTCCCTESLTCYPAC